MGQTDAAQTLALCF